MVRFARMFRALTQGRAVVACLLWLSACDGREAKPRAPVSIPDAETPSMAADAQPDLMVAATVGREIYLGPSEAVVVIDSGVVVAFRLMYVGNTGLMFTGGRIGQDGHWPVTAGTFMLAAAGISVRGMFVSPQHLEGTWVEGKFRGTWSAERIKGDAAVPDFGYTTPLPPVPTMPDPNIPTTPPRDAAAPDRPRDAAPDVRDAARRG